MLLAETNAPPDEVFLASSLRNSGRTVGSSPAIATSTTPKTATPRPTMVTAHPNGVKKAPVPSTAGISPAREMPNPPTASIFPPDVDAPGLKVHMATSVILFCTRAV